MPVSCFGIDVDYSMSKHWAVSFGANYSTVDGRGLWGYRIGLGLYSETPTSALRLDGGLQWQDLFYEASSIVVKRTSDVSTSNDEVGFFLDRGTSMPLDFYCAMTINTKHSDWFTNIFVQLALSKQSLAKFKPSIVQPSAPYAFPLYSPVVIVHDQRAEFSSTFVVITPGVYFDVDPSVHILVGTRINLQTQIKDGSPSAIVLPFLQLDWML